MAVLYIPVGISGCGKSTFYSHLKGGIEKVCQDDIRRKMGNVSDQSRNFIVWKIATNKLTKFNQNGADVYFDSTNLTLRDIKKVISNVTSDTEIKIILFNDSEHWEECQKRVKADIENGKDRSRTFDVEVDGVPLQKVMSDKFIALKQNPKFWEFCKDKNIEVVEV
jgi:predicted kinase